MIDYLMQFKSEDAAKADPVVGKYWSADDNSWDLATVIAGPFLWNPADDIVSVVHGPGDEVWPYSKRVPFDKNWYILIGLAEENEALEDEPSCALAIVRESGDILQSTFTTLQLSFLHLEPLFSGSGWGQGKPVGVK